jgi:hypothetical protein
MGNKSIFIGLGCGGLSILIALGAYAIFKPNINPEVVKQEVEKNIQNTQNSIKDATNAF